MGPVHWSPKRCATLCRSTVARCHPQCILFSCLSQAAWTGVKSQIHCFQSLHCWERFSSFTSSSASLISAAANFSLSYRIYPDPISYGTTDTGISLLPSSSGTSTPGGLGQLPEPTLSCAFSTHIRLYGSRIRIPSILSGMTRSGYYVLHVLTALADNISI